MLSWCGDVFCSKSLFVLRSGWYRGGDIVRIVEPVGGYAVVTFVIMNMYMHIFHCFVMCENTQSMVELYQFFFQWMLPFT